MLSLRLIALASLLTVAAAVPCRPPVYSGPPPNITAITPLTLVTGLNVDQLNGVAVLDSKGIGGFLFFDNGTIAEEYITCQPSYLTIGTSDKSYKPLTWETTQITGQWDADFSQIVKAIDPPSSEFLACKPVVSGGPEPWTLYLQTGTDKPVEGACVTTKLRVTHNVA